MSHIEVGKMESLCLQEMTKLNTLPLDILLIIISYFDTARSFAGVASTCRSLAQVVKADGWRIFVKTQFGSLSIPPNTTTCWNDLARSLTWQSRAWDKRAFVFDTFAPKPTGPLIPAGGQHRRRAQMHSHGSQTVPCQIVVDAHTQFNGAQQRETVVWGAGENLVTRTRLKKKNEIISDKWFTSEGSTAGFASGRDDVTSISVFRPSQTQVQGENIGVLVGRASGDLRLVSLTSSGFGQTLQNFRPSQSENVKNHVRQTEIQSFDTGDRQKLLATSTKDNVLLYPLDSTSMIPEEKESMELEKMRNIEPIEAVDLRRAEGSAPFKFLRSLKFMGNGDLAIGLTSSAQPLRIMKITPTGTEVDTAAKMRPSKRAAATYALKDWENSTARGLLPIDSTAIPGGGGNVLLSSYEDGTVRLQDIRTPSAIDTIYGDHFEPTTPISTLVSYGAERFIGGSARSSVIKIFDFRWTKGYTYTASLPCGNDNPFPAPKLPTLVSAPTYDNRRKCNHVSGQKCTWHALSTVDYYRPNANIYLRVMRTNHRTQPCYISSLAKPSDISTTLYAGLAGELVEMNLTGNVGMDEPMPGSNHHGMPYKQSRGPGNIIETGDGLALDDISYSSRMPVMRSQVPIAALLLKRIPTTSRKRHRLDESYQQFEDHFIDAVSTCRHSVTE
ncbi:uncharacterized protein BCR38DRAFT_241264 [Pseudomassariella vexata]|uniref:F-box domain-containing protein n=1 Tax=Pseudomassariella vexata TaxID=1141098 RepID=A0A1Y2DTA0_9PEZI|nr:uncharacterized protein BCR38DRAFT_241264 [Pseudomassariella vexata]ORY62502.1 hypothetical protein BCR38DRAFT_241264 [Pseudomassariella vexata]